MKVLIQDCKSGEYLAENGGWTAAVLQARDFRFSACAYSAMRREKTPGLRVLFYFEDLDYAVKVPRGSGERICRRLSATAFDL